MDSWSDYSRKAAVTRLVKADIPLDGIYYWYPTPRGWELLPWYLDDEPNESPEDRQRRFSRLQHPLVWSEVLNLLVQRWGIPATVLEPIRQRHDAFPRGRVYRNRVGCGEYEAVRIPGSFERVCRTFHRQPTSMQVITDGHWDASESTLPVVEHVMGNGWIVF